LRIKAIAQGHGELTLADLQRHINRRREKQYCGQRLSPVTLKKEMGSFGAAWNRAVHMGLVSGPFPSRGLVYPKADEAPPFMTRAVLLGYQVLRHSFISACASKGVDQRLIDEWTSHSTAEQRRRYRHLYPTTQQEAISKVFGWKP
jgi:hypothetical protein